MIGVANKFSVTDAYVCRLVVSQYRYPFTRPCSDSTFPRSCDTYICQMLRVIRTQINVRSQGSLYKDFMLEYLALGHMSVAKAPGRNYIHHHAICKMEGGDTKISSKNPQVVKSLSVSESSLGHALESHIIAGTQIAT